VVPLRLPPLRERVEDVPDLMRHFFAQAEREGLPQKQIDQTALDQLKRYRWPGNVRELQSVLKQAILRLNGPILLPEYLPQEICGTPQEVCFSPSDESQSTVIDQFVEERLKAGSQELYSEAVNFLERHLLTDVLRYTEGNQSHAAKILGITRGSLRSKIRMLGIKIDREIHFNEAQRSLTAEYSGITGKKR
jgi:two-component system nitrogen regulation response regulator GlnG